MGLACDPCSIRKIKCYEGLPCQQCLVASLSCSYDRKRKKSGPKGPRKRTKEAIEQVQQSSQQARQQTVDNGPGIGAVIATPHLGWSSAQSDLCGASNDQGQDKAYDSPSNVTAKANDRVPISSLKYYLSTYNSCLHVVWPVVDYEKLLVQLHDPDDKIAYALGTSICSATMAQLQLPPDEHGNSSHSMAYEAEKTRLMLDHPKHRSSDALLTCFFLHAYYSDTGKITKSTLLLREAIAHAHILGLHQNLFYADLDAETSQYYLRIAWILFITDRAHSLQNDLPSTFKLSPALPELQSQHGAGLGSAFCSLCKLFQAFDDACPPEVRSKQIGFLGAISSQLQKRHALPLCENEIQRADIVVTDSWLRVVLWKAAIPYVDANTDPYDQNLNVSFPTSVAHDLLSKLTTLSSCALETHGPGMMSKLFEIANSVADVLICAPDLANVDSVHVGPRDILAALSSLIASLRTTGNPALLTLLREKMMACALDQAAPARLLQITDVTNEDLCDENDSLSE
ncbi:sucrose utilization suc1 [Fusarium longipes]|uniref:Sucrose utilization suc1 n=1 Tax=Fusarium longipes TaxID=694270 RepID=A0A395T6E0_9HYPO|nr:sucrose utilization suc1 [Fusarium longipes]